MGRFICSDVVTSTGQGLLGNNMFAYCANNPVSHADNSGHAVETVLDLISLGASIADVASNPSDVWAWAGLAGDLVDVLLPFFGGAGETIRVAKAAAEVVDTVDDLHDTAKVVDKVSDSQELLNDIMKNGACFVAGTLVYTADGNKPIEQVRQNDLVWAWDESTGDVSLKRVVETYVKESSELIHVYVNGEEIICTPTHPFYSPVKGWTDAVYLRAGDILVLVNGKYVVVDEVQNEILEVPVTVYNFQVEDYHTYYVSRSSVCVHNLCNNKLPIDYSPNGAGRHGAFAQAKRDLGIPVSKQPVVLPNVDRRGNIVAGRVYDFDGIQIRDDVMGHVFDDGGYLPPHFNTPDGKHYFY